MSQNLGQMFQKQAQDRWRRNMEGAHWLATKQKGKNQFEVPKRWHPVRTLMKLLLLLALIVAVIALIALRS